MELVIKVPQADFLRKSTRPWKVSVCLLLNVQCSTAMLILGAKINDFPHTIINAHFLGVPVNSCCTC